jgi:hypothetical protein
MARKSGAESTAGVGSVRRADMGGRPQGPLQRDVPAKNYLSSGVRADKKIAKPSPLLDTRVLKKTGSFYYHCDWHASHYVKVMLDQIFGEN